MLHNKSLQRPKALHQQAFISHFWSTEQLWSFWFQLGLASGYRSSSGLHPVSLILFGPVAPGWVLFMVNSSSRGQSRLSEHFSNSCSDYICYSPWPKTSLVTKPKLSRAGSIQEEERKYMANNNWVYHKHLKRNNCGGDGEAVLCNVVRKGAFEGS